MAQVESKQGKNSVSWTKMRHKASQLAWMQQVDMHGKIFQQRLTGGSDPKIARRNARRGRREGAGYIRTSDFLRTQDPGYHSWAEQLERENDPTSLPLHPSHTLPDVSGVTGGSDILHAPLSSFLPPEPCPVHDLGLHMNTNESKLAVRFDEKQGCSVLETAPYTRRVGGRGCSCGMGPSTPSEYDNDEEYGDGHDDEDEKEEYVGGGAKGSVTSLKLTIYVTPPPGYTWELATGALDKAQEKVVLLEQNSQAGTDDSKSKFWKRLRIGNDIGNTNTAVPFRMSDLLITDDSADKDRRGILVRLAKIDPSPVAADGSVPPVPPEISEYDVKDLHGGKHMRWIFIGTKRSITKPTERNWFGFARSGSGKTSLELFLVLRVHAPSTGSNHPSLLENLNRAMGGLALMFPVSPQQPDTPNWLVVGSGTPEQARASGHTFSLQIEVEMKLPNSFVCLLDEFTTTLSKDVNGVPSCPQVQYNPETSQITIASQPIPLDPSGKLQTSNASKFAMILPSPKSAVTQYAVRATSAEPYYAAVSPLSPRCDVALRGDNNTTEYDCDTCPNAQMFGTDLYSEKARQRYENYIGNKLNNLVTVREVCRALAREDRNLSSSANTDTPTSLPKPESKETNPTFIEKSNGQSMPIDKQGMNQLALTAPTNTTIPSAPPLQPPTLLRQTPVQKTLTTRQQNLKRQNSVTRAAPQTQKKFIAPQPDTNGAMSSVTRTTSNTDLAPREAITANKLKGVTLRKPPVDQIKQEKPQTGINGLVQTLSMNSVIQQGLTQRAKALRREESDSGEESDWGDDN